MGKQHIHWSLPPEAVDLVAKRFKVLSEPIRIQLLQALHSGKLSVNDVTLAVGSTQPNVSKHLKLLQDAGLVARAQKGNTVYYSIADDSVFKLCDVVCTSLKEKFAEQHEIFA